MRTQHLLLVAVLYTGSVAATPGSWSGEASAIEIYNLGRVHQSRPLHPPVAASVAGRRISRLRWSFEIESAGQAVRASLCSGRSCVELPGSGGVTDGFAGFPVGTPFYFRFDCAGSGPLPVRIARIQLLVNYVDANT